MIKFNKWSNCLNLCRIFVCVMQWGVLAYIAYIYIYPVAYIPIYGQHNYPLGYIINNMLFGSSLNRNADYNWHRCHHWIVASFISIHHTIMMHKRQAIKVLSKKNWNQSYSNQITLIVQIFLLSFQCILTNRYM